MQHCLFLLTNDTGPTLADLQEKFIRRFFCERLEDVLKHMTESEQITTCDWQGITCVDGVIWSLFFRDDPIGGNFSIEWAPSSVEVLHIQGCEQRRRIETRLLPRCALCIDLSDNLYEGTLEIRTLPMHLVKLHVQQNHLSGKIYFTNLPKSLNSLDISFNWFDAKDVFCDDLVVAQKFIVRSACTNVTPKLKPVPR